MDPIRQDLLDIVEDFVIPAIEEYYHQIPEEDWEDLITSYEDIKQHTIYLLKYLTTVFSDVASDLVENRQFSYKELKAAFDDIVSNAFTQAMVVEETITEECTEILNMLFVKHVLTTVTSPLDDEDPTEWLKVGLEFRCLVDPVIRFVQTLIKIKKSSREEQEDTVRLFVKSLMSHGLGP